jgi:hypothetical protein
MYRLANTEHPMLHTAALPFVLHREHGIISGREVTSTRDELHGLLYLDGEQLVFQWRTSREISRVGHEIRTDRELGTVREVALPLSALAGASVRRVWRGWWFAEALVLTAADLKAFDALTGEGEMPGLVLEHPAEIVLDVRRTDRILVREFVSKLRLAISEHLLASIEGQLQEHRLPGRELPP